MGATDPARTVKRRGMDGGRVGERETLISWGALENTAVMDGSVINSFG